MGGYDAMAELIIQKKYNDCDGSDDSDYDNVESLGYLETCICGYEGDCSDDEDKFITINSEFINFDLIKQKYGDFCRVVLKLSKN
jgi:hypothetical protein